MSAEEAEQLLISYTKGTCTESEKALVERWLFSVNNGPLDLTEERMKAISQDVLAHLPKAPAVRMWQTTLFRRTAVAAGIMLVIGTSWYFFAQKNARKTSTIQYADIEAGGTRAVLTISGGKQIVLDHATNGTLVKEGNTTVNKSGNGQLTYLKGNGVGENPVYNTLTTPRGGQFSVTLSDGTRAWLNAASAITYPTQFTGATRDVTIKGEVYFEVAHNKAMPFRVMAGKETVEVLGTHFNINAYSDEPSINTTLLEGSVKVTAGIANKIIKPGEQAVLSNDELQVTNADTDAVIAWKNGTFQFNEEPMESIMHKISRWYDVEILYTSDDIKQIPFTGIVPHTYTLRKVLRMLELTKKVHFKISGKSIIVMK
jgi:transmembrane sensor